MTNIADKVVHSQITLQEQMKKVGHRMSNSNTIGHKGEFSVSVADKIMKPYGGEDVFYKTIQYIDLTPGELKPTGAPLDLALAGEKVFFQVQDPNTQELFLTRNGSFHLNNQGQMVNGQGFLLQSNGGGVDIPLNAQEVVVNAKGDIIVDGNILTRIAVVLPENERDLQIHKSGNFTVQGNIEVGEQYEVFQGFLEMSNVSPIKDTVLMQRYIQESMMVRKILDQDVKREEDAISNLARIA